ncbi:hypothetical protein KUTeg_012996 [Tegillarca granosa]|uniref:Methyltransferase domain-containing protein n=1 Tax=Tegillarca granosa TaxID=220873 RepID=A0ABQ9ESE7_TEGGR|nr:hypothetical protein KUTeg_012996 [Tegillarca granosa]
MAADDNTQGLLTEAIVSYDGIFKGMYDDNLKKLFIESRKMFAEGKWKEAKSILSQALNEAKENAADKKALQLIFSEVERCEACKIDSATQPSDVNWTDVVKRPLSRLKESSFGLPQSIFFLNVGKAGNPGFKRLVGRKTLSDMWLAYKIPEIHCSMVTAEMILGIFYEERVTDCGIDIFYYPIEKNEKLKIMADIMKGELSNIEIVDPFPLLRPTTRKELCSPPEGWIVDDAYDVMLSCGEDRIRDYTKKFLTTKNLTTPRLYDPACSTGVFLSTLKKAFPNSHTIGQDLSQQMADFSRERVDEVYCGNAMFPKIELYSADVVFVRFLNSEVVTSTEAEELLQALLPTVKVGGYMVIFGHTPVLLSSANFLMIGDFNLEQCVAVDVNKNGIFQYYVLRRTLVK